MTQGTVTITFDDAYRSTYDTAFPLLRDMDMPAALFVITRWLGRSVRYKGKRIVTAEECTELAGAGWEIGSHTVSHPNLVHVSDARLEAELADSRRMLESNGFDVRTIAYPGGAFDRRVYEAAARLYTYHRLAIAGRPFRTSTDPHGILGNTLSDSVFKDDRWEQMLADVAQKSQWAVFVVHDLSENESGDPIGLQVANFRTFLEAIRELDVDVLTLQQAAEKHLAGIQPVFPSDYAVAPEGFQYRSTRALYRLGLAPLLKKVAHETRAGVRVELAIWNLLSRVKNRKESS